MKKKIIHVTKITLISLGLFFIFTIIVAIFVGLNDEKKAIEKENISEEIVLEQKKEEIEKEFESNYKEKECIPEIKEVEKIIYEKQECISETKEVEKIVYKEKQCTPEIKEIEKVVYKEKSCPSVQSSNTSLKNSDLKFSFLECYDGDTCKFNISNTQPIFGEKINIRINGIDTPEIRGKCEKEKSLAKDARDFVVNKIKKSKILKVEVVERDKYFRIVGNIYVDGKSIKNILLEEKMAVSYDGGKKIKDWCQ